MRTSRPRRAVTGRSDSDLDRADRKLLRVLDRDLARAAELAGSWLRCAPGCTACCIGPFPITRLDARRLGGGMAHMQAREPSRAQAVRERARSAVATLRDGFPGDAGSGRLVDDTARLDVFFAHHRGLACPALDPSSGHCELYTFRPVTCRTYGPPVRFGDHEAPPCDLCFHGATRREIERCRIAPDRTGIEEAILRRVCGSADEDWETLVAFALAGE